MRLTGNGRETTLATRLERFRPITSVRASLEIGIVAHNLTWTTQSTNSTPTHLTGVLQPSHGQLTGRLFGHSRPQTPTTVLINIPNRPRSFILAYGVLVIPTAIRIPSAGLEAIPTSPRHLSLLMSKVSRSATRTHAPSMSMATRVEVGKASNA